MCCRYFSKKWFSKIVTLLLPGEELRRNIRLAQKSHPWTMKTWVASRNQKYVIGRHLSGTSYHIPCSQNLTNLQHIKSRIIRFLLCTIIGDAELPDSVYRDYQKILILRYKHIGNAMFIHRISYLLDYGSNKFANSYGI